MRSEELIVRAGDANLAATLRLPDGRLRAGIVTLHPASGPERDYFLFRHLADLVASHGIAVLSYDRRPADGDDAVSFDLQAHDALAAAGVLGHRLPAGAPVGLWAFSQGCWAAPLAATRSEQVAFLVLVGAPGVSPAEQMRYSAAEMLRRASYPDQDIARAVDARMAIERFLRGSLSHAEAQRNIDGVSREPWFELLFLPRVLPEGVTWSDMDFDPVPVLSGVRCPVLLIYGDDEAVPVEPSVRAWRGARTPSSVPVDVVMLPRSTHLPTIGGGTGIDSVDPDYERALVSWLEQQGAAR